MGGYPQRAGCTTRRLAVRLWLEAKLGALGVAPAGAEEPLESLLFDSNAARAARGDVDQAGRHALGFRDVLRLGDQNVDLSGVFLG